jgi:hypothetical protein
MALKYYVPVSVLCFAFMVTLVHHYGIPVLPFALILLVAETALGFQVEDHRISQRVFGFLRALKPNQHDDMHQAH